MILNDLTKSTTINVIHQDDFYLVCIYSYNNACVLIIDYGSQDDSEVPFTSDGRYQLWDSECIRKPIPNHLLATHNYN